MKLLTIFNGVQLQVDDDSFDKFAQHSWYLNHYGYAVRAIGTNGKANRKAIWMHREVIGADALKGKTRLFVDHIDRNPLNNQRANLRVCTHSQNLANRPKPSGKPGYKGVYWHGRAGKWMARITVFYKPVYLGLFVDPKEAARAYDKAALEHFREFAWTNNV